MKLFEIGASLIFPIKGTKPSLPVMVSMECVGMMPALGHRLGGYYLI